MSTVALRAVRFSGSSASRAVLILGLLALALAGASGWTPSVPALSTPDLPPQTAGLAAAPAALRTALSTSLGAQESSFAVSRQGETLVARGGGLSTVFGPAGPVVRSGRADLGLLFAGLGYGDKLTQPGAALRTASGNDVSYRRAGVTEWYRNGPLGLEQGFSIARRPAGAGALLTVALQASGSLRASLAGPQIVFADHAGRSVFRYGDLSATDATGRSLPVQLQLRGRTVLLRVGDAGARYPLTIDPFVQQGAELTPTDEVGRSNFGWSVALSADGNTALISAPYDSTNAFGSPGAVWVFVRTGSTWAQQGPKLVGNSIDALFGTTVALSADGNTALIGGMEDNQHVGAAWVFSRSGSSWTQQGPTLRPNDEVGEGGFGMSVDLSADGNTALIGGYTDNNITGAAWIFSRSGSTWTQEGAKLTGAGEVGAGQFGYSSALSGDGNTALIGGPTDNNGAGAAWVFTRSGATWTEQGAKLAPDDETGAGQFGWSTALTADGNTALIGGLFDNNDAGAAWHFARSGEAWAQQGAKIVSGEDPAVLEAFGVFTALSADGRTAMIGGLNPNPDSAIEFLYETSGSTWTQQDATAGGVPGSGLGRGAALSTDGSTILVGGDHANNNVGGVWAFTLSPTDPPTNVAATAGDGQATVSFTAPVSDGGAPATSYTVTASPGGESATGSGSPITVTGLTDGTSYTFTVTATNSAGPGSASAASNSVTPVASSSSGGGESGGSGTTSSAAGPAAPPATAPTSNTPATTAAAKRAATVAILRVQTVRLGKQPKLRVTLKLSRTSKVALTLDGSTGKVVARWTLHLAAGTRNLVLALPAKARHRGRDTLRVQIGNAKAKTVAVLVRP